MYDLTSSYIVRANGSRPLTRGMSSRAASLNTAALVAFQGSPRGGPSCFRNASKASFSIVPEPVHHETSGTHGPRSSGSAAVTTFGSAQLCNHTCQLSQRSRAGNQARHSSRVATNS